MLKIPDSPELVRVLSKVGFVVFQDPPNFGVSLRWRPTDRQVCIEIAVDEADAQCIDEDPYLRNSLARTIDRLDLIKCFAD
ncbi:hypothetical protein ASG57_29810 [Bradyrhizobium sp. Leaf396]|nr:hypothetical protein ASG57_29810 [Bradyrhizobium sp. Leaf396]